MPPGLTLTELEAYRVEVNNALREGRPCKYLNPRELFAEDPNLDSYLVEKSAKQLKEEEDNMDGTTPGGPFLTDPGQAVAEKAAMSSGDEPGVHQNLQNTPNPEPPGTVSEETPEEENTETPSAS